MTSWLVSLMSPAKTWALSRRFCKYGNILNRYLNGGTKAKAEIKPLPSLKEVEKIIGSLTTLRAANVDTEKLARVAIQHNFHQYIRRGNPVYKKRIQAFIDVLPKHPVHSHGLIDTPKVLADVVESVLAAVFIDSNCSIDTTWEIASYILKPMITPESLQSNSVKNLFEICQKCKLKVRLEDMWSQDGTYKVFVNDQLEGKGICHEKKKIALNRAANDAYKEVVRKMSMTRSPDAGC